ncbi:hypothetical protein FB451DRAFT_1377238, partial [Mycena latifolia]
MSTYDTRPTGQLEDGDVISMRLASESVSHFPNRDEMSLDPPGPRASRNQMPASGRAKKSASRSLLRDLPRVETSRSCLPYQFRRQIEATERMQRSLDRMRKSNELQLGALLKTQQQVSAELATLVAVLTRVSPAPRHETAEDDETVIPGSDWTLDPEQESQVLVPRSTLRRRSESPEDPYMPSIDSQI